MKIVLRGWIEFYRSLKGRCLLVLFLLGFHRLSQADLPTVPAPSGLPTGNDDNYVVWLQFWIGDVARMAGLVISALLFIWSAWICFSKFNEARSSNNPDWGSVGLTAIVSACLLIVTAFFLTESTEVFTTTAAP